MAPASVCAASTRVDLDTDYRIQFAELMQQIAAMPDAKVVATTQRPAALILPTDCDPADVVLRRAGAMLDHLTTTKAGRAASLAALNHRNAGVSMADGAGRYALYLSACRLRREIAFANPLLEFERILFVKRHHARGNHMCDQFFGFTAVAGGGLFTLTGVIGPEPLAHNVLAGASVETAGRLHGQSLTAGAFLSPDLFHHNYNTWQADWPLPDANHPELADPWISYNLGMIPRYKNLAKVTYGLDGLHVPISSFLHEPDPANCKSKNQRQMSMNPWGLTIGLQAMTLQNSWQKYLCDQDVAYMKEKIHPFLREVATFYVALVEKCQRDDKGKVRLGPSYSPERGSPGIFNCPFDIAYVHVMFNIARARLSMPEEFTEGRRWFASRELPNGLFVWAGHKHGTFMGENDRHCRIDQRISEGEKQRRSQKAQP